MYPSSMLSLWPLELYALGVPLCGLQGSFRCVRLITVHGLIGMAVPLPSWLVAKLHCVEAASS